MNMNVRMTNHTARILFHCALMAPPLLQAADQYFLLNYSASASLSTNVMTYVQQKFGAANRASALKVGVAVLYSPKDQVQSCLSLMTNDLAMAQRLNVPILLQVDTENWLPESLLNWHDPARSGYDPAKTADVEWYGWTPETAIKLCWRNWGVQVRTGPQPNLLSTNFQAWEKNIYAMFIPPAVQWYNRLPDGQKHLFVGWKCGWETTLNSQYYYYTNGNSFYSRTNDPPWSTSRQIIGYNAARTGGFKTNGVLDYTQANGNYDVFMKIMGKHLTFLASLACSNGIPRHKIFLHSIAEGVDRYNTNKLVNPYGNPGASCYARDSRDALRYNKSFMRAVATAKQNYGATGYGYGEFNLSATNYAAWFDWFTNTLREDPDCVFQALYNYDSMQGKPTVEQAMLAAMALYSAK